MQVVLIVEYNKIGETLIIDRTVFFPFQMELFFLLSSNFCFRFNSMSSRAALCMYTSEEMCNEEVFIFFSAAWFLLPLVMLLAFYKHFFLLFVLPISLSCHGVSEIYRINVNLQHRLLHDVPDTHCVDKEGGLNQAGLVKGKILNCQKKFKVSLDFDDSSISEMNI